jgi:hypothetical protein
MPSRRAFLTGVASLAATTLASPASAASPPAQTWSRTYEPKGNRQTLVHDIVPLESGFGLVGLSGTLHEYTGWLSRVNVAGRSQWHTLAGPTDGSFLAGAPAAGEPAGLVATGVTNVGQGPWTPDYSDPYVVRANLAGELSWTKTYQPTLPHGGADTLASVPDGFVLAGSGGDDSTHPWAARITGDGTQQWTYHHDEAGSVNAALGRDSGAVVAGSTWPAGADSPAPRARQEAAWVARLAADGSLDWQWRVDPENGARIEALAPHPDGGVVAVGRRGFATENRGVGWLVALDAAGNRRWARTYPQESWNWHQDVVSVDGGYVLVGTREMDAETDARGAWLLRVDADGRVVWDLQAATGTDAQTAHALPDGGILVAGERATDARERNAGWLGKFGGEPAPGSNGGPNVSLPSPPSWAGPALAGGVVGAVGARAVARWRQSRSDVNQ